MMVTFRHAVRFHHTVEIFPIRGQNEQSVDKLLTWVAISTPLNSSGQALQRISSF